MCLQVWCLWCQELLCLSAQAMTVPLLLLHTRWCWSVPHKRLLTCILSCLGLEVWLLVPNGVKLVLFFLSFSLGLPFSGLIFFQSALLRRVLLMPPSMSSLMLEGWGAVLWSRVVIDIVAVSLFAFLPWSARTPSVLLSITFNDSWFVRVPLPV